MKDNKFIYNLTEGVIVLNELKKDWLSNIKGDLLAGLVTCMALIPETIGFALVAGVNPMFAIYSSFCFSIITAIFGGRPGLISAAAGSMALVLVSLVKNYGVEYMLLATILAGILQVILGFFKVGKLMKYISDPIMTGFVNALGIMMFKSQLPHFKGNYILLILGAIGIAIIYLFPKITKVIPSPIISIVIVYLLVLIFKIDIPKLGDMGTITTELPKFKIPNVSLSLQTLKIILPYSISLAIVGLLESLLTAQLLDDLTKTTSDKNRESVGQGLANIVTGFFGGIAGCGMIGQTILNHNYGGKGRLSTFSAGIFILLFVIVFNKFIVSIPIVALSAVMVVIAISTFKWKSIININKIPIRDTIIMIVTVIIVLLTSNLAYGVIVALILDKLLTLINFNKG